MVIFIFADMAVRVAHGLSCGSNYLIDFYLYFLFGLELVLEVKVVLVISFFDSRSFRKSPSLRWSARVCKTILVIVLGSPSVFGGYLGFSSLVCPELALLLQWSSRAHVPTPIAI